MSPEVNSTFGIIGRPESSNALSIEKEWSVVENDRNAVVLATSIPGQSRRPNPNAIVNGSNGSS